MNKTWFRELSVYQIWPRSFCDGNGDGVGDLKGVLGKLDYIKSLGVDAIWFSPLYVSPQKDYGYDIADYYNINPEYGTMEDFDAVLAGAHERGMKVIMDLVVNHTSDQHEWFKKSAAKDPKYKDYYIWRPGRGKDGRKFPNNWMSTFPGNAWEWNEERGEYYLHLFAVEQPDLNHDNPAVREEVKKVMRFWLDLGTDGFRVDMALKLVKDDDEGRPENIRLWQDFRAFLDREYPYCAMVSEWGVPKESIAGGFHMDFMLHFGPPAYTSLFRSEHPFFSKEGRGDISLFLNTYLPTLASTEGKGLICIPSGNHDMPRLSRGRDMLDLKICFAFLLTMSGAPFLYYGDEIGMRYLEGIRSVEGGYDRTGSRSPMQWKRGAGMGFTTGTTPYIPFDREKDAPTVAAQEGDGASLLENVKALLALRRAHAALTSFGEFVPVYAEAGRYPFAYERRSADERILVVLNPSGSEQPVLFDASGEVLWSTGGVPAAGIVPARSAAILRRPM